jgi:hypothetical protein
MEDIRLPRYVIDRLEHRWASRLQQESKTGSIDPSKPMQSRHVRRPAGHVQASHSNRSASLLASAALWISADFPEVTIEQPLGMVIAAARGVFPQRTSPLGSALPLLR